MIYKYIFMVYMYVYDIYVYIYIYIGIYIFGIYVCIIYNNALYPYHCKTLRHEIMSYFSRHRRQEPGASFSFTSLPHVRSVIHVTEECLGAGEPLKAKTAWE